MVGVKAEVPMQGDTVEVEEGASEVPTLGHIMEGSLRGRVM